MNSLASLFADSGVPSAGTWLLLGKATFLLIAAWVATVALRKSSAGMRHLVWVITFASLVILPAVAGRLPLHLAVLPSSFGTASVNPPPALPSAAETAIAADGENITSTRLTASPAGELASGSVAVPPSGNSDGGSRSFSALAVLLLGWAAGAAACLLWLAHGTWAVRGIVRRATPMNVGVWEASLWEVADRIGLDSVPALVSSRDVSMPFASGLIHPVIVLPHDAASWNDDRRTSVLLHELAHIRRRDLLGHTLGRIACALYWFHPLVWTAARQLRVESERACDDIALACGARPSDYAEQLLDIVTSVRRQFTPAVALAMAHRKEFEGRMLAILDPDVRRSAPTRRQTVLSITTLALMSLVVGAAVPASAIPDQQATRTEAERSGRAPQLPAESSFRRITDRSMSVEVRSQTLTNKTRRDPAGRVEDAEPASDVQQGPDRGQVDRAVAALTREVLAEGTRIGAESLREMLGVMQERAEQKGQQDERTRLLMNVLKTDTSATLRRIAAWGLAEHTNETGVTAALAEALRKDASAEVREMSAWALGDAGKDRAASDALVAAAKSDTDDKVRATAIWALGDAGDESALGVLTTALSSRDTRLREVALWAIGNMEPSKAPREVIAALGDSSARVRKLAAWALFNIGDPDAVSALEAGFDREKEPEVRRAFVRALAATGEKSADALSKLLGSNDPEVRALAVKALAGAGAAGPWPWPWPKPRPFP